MSERTIPHALEAEQAVLGAVMSDPRAFDAVAQIVGEQSFFLDAHRVAWRAIQGLVSRGELCDAIAVFEACRDAGEAERCGGLPYLNAMTEGGYSQSQAVAYAKRVREMAARRALIALADEVVSAAYAGKHNAAELADQAGTQIAQLAAAGDAKAPRRIADIALARVDHYVALHEGKTEPGWPTGLPRLDDMLSGGGRPGKLWIVAARPGIGKSSMTLHLGLQWARRGLPTLICSQEMPDDEVADRAVASVARVDMASLLSGRLSVEHWSRAAEGFEDMAKLPLHIDDEPALTLAAIRRKARQVRGLKVLIVDYLQLCAGAGEDNRNGEIETISRGLKALAKSDGLLVVALSQLNRQVESRTSKRPNLSDLRDSGAIEQDADVVMLMWEHKEHTDGMRTIGLHVAKNRQGRRGEMALWFDGSTQRWGESTESLEPQQTTQQRGRNL